MATATLRSSYSVLPQMAALLITIFVVKVTTAIEEMALLNVTRTLTGDIFTLSGSNCGPTRCMEVSHGTALSAMNSAAGCSCQCSSDTPAFREDQMTCVNQIEEYLMASFGGAKRPIIPYVFLPLKGQIIYPSKEIIFTDVEEATCAVTSAQYLSPSGWVTLRDVTDNDVPFSVYRDEGSTFLQWRGSGTLHARLEGRLVAVHVLCSAHAQPRVVTSCAAFRIAGNASPTGLFDVRSIPFHAGEVVTTEPSHPTNAGLTVLESVAIGVCVLMLIFVYAAGILFYIHYKKRQKRKEKDPELSHTITTDNTSEINSRIDFDSLRLKQNPLLKIENLSYSNKGYTNDGGLSDASEHTDENMYTHNSNVSQKVSAMIHSRRKKQARAQGSRSPSTPERILEMSQRRSVSPDGLELAPHSDLAIVDCSVENNTVNKNSPSPTGEPASRRKLYFNPVFFETEHLKNPPPAAIDFLIKIREVMDLAKEKMTCKRFIPILSDIAEEESYHTIDLGWDIPCARQGRRFSAISLKRENSRRAIHCGGCPGCDNDIRALKSSGLSRSNSCKECISDDYKQNVVRKWLDEVPSPPQVAVKPIKSVAKVSGTPRVIEPKAKEETVPNIIENTRDIVNQLSKPVHATTILHYDLEQDIKAESKEQPLIIEDNKIPPYLLDNTIPKKTGTRRVRKNLPPPPPPPQVEEVEPISLEVKKKMQAVIQELNKCRRQDNVTNKEEAPKIVIPITAVDTQYKNTDNLVTKVQKSEIAKHDQSMYFDSLERDISRKRRDSKEYVAKPLRKQAKFILHNTHSANDIVKHNWHDTKEAGDGCSTEYFESQYGNRSLPVNEIFVKQEEQFYSNVPKTGALTIEVRGSPVDDIQSVKEDFDPDTLDRNPRRNSICTEVTKPTKRVEKILLKSGGSFKYSSFSTSDGFNHHKVKNLNIATDEAFSKKIGSLRQIFEARKSFNQDDIAKPYHERRGSLPYGSTDVTLVKKHLKAPDLIQQIDFGDIKPPLPFKLRRGSDASSRFSRRSSVSDTRQSEDRDAFPPNDDDTPRRSGRRSTRTRSKRTDLKKLTKKIEDSGYLSTDSNESKRKAKYLMQVRPKNTLSDSIPVQVHIRPQNVNITVQVESDTDDFESLCDGRSESGAESIETDSVFFGNIDDPKLMLSEFEVTCERTSDMNKGQVDSGFVGEAVILSGDSDSEHKSVISIIAGRDGRGSAASVLCDDEEQCGTPVD